MEEQESKDREREEIFSRSVRAGKRTYFFDVKSTIGNEHYLTITESKRRFSNEEGKFFYEKHKLFLYREDFDKFIIGLSDAIEFVKTGKAPVRAEEPTDGKEMDDSFTKGTHRGLTFEDLEKEHDSN